MQRVVVLVVALCVLLPTVVVTRPIDRRRHQHQRRPRVLTPHALASKTRDHDLVARHAATDGAVSLLQMYATTHLHSGSTVERSAAAHFGLSVEQFRAAHLELSAQKTAHMTGEGATCSGLVPSLCPGRAGIHGGPGDWLDSIAEECGEIFCSPMCMRNTWTCAVEFGDLEPEAEDPAYSKALCGQFYAEGCTSILGCCAKDDKMTDYVEDHQYQDRFPVPYLPTPSCEHDAKDSAEEGKVCDKCSAAVEVNLEVVDCPFPVVDPEEDDAFVEVSVASGAAAAAALEAQIKDRARVDTMSMEDLLLEIKALRKEMKLPRRELADDEVMFGGGSVDEVAAPASTLNDADEHMSSDENSGRSIPDSSAAADVALLQIDNRVTGQGVLSATSLVSTAATTAVTTAATTHATEPWDAGPAKFKSLKYRCEKLKAVVEGALPGMQEAFKAKACSCMGCCKGECFFHVKERMTE